jgi:hypothetical protein
LGIQCVSLWDFVNVVEGGQSDGLGADIAAAGIMVKEGALAHSISVQAGRFPVAGSLGKYPVARGFLSSAAIVG